MTETRVNGAATVDGAVRVPGDKSISHGALILGTLIRGRSYIGNLSPAADVAATIPLTLLLHAAGNICGRSLRLLHLHDISLLAKRMATNDWDALWDDRATDAPWWALPPLRLVARYYRHAIPDTLFARLERDCPPLLRTISRRQTLTQVSCSALWLHAFAGIDDGVLTALRERLGCAINLRGNRLTLEGEVSELTCPRTRVPAGTTIRA